MKYKDTELGHGRRTWEKGKEMEMGSEMEKSTDLRTRKEMEKELESDISFERVKMKINLSYRMQETGSS